MASECVVSRGSEAGHSAIYLDSDMLHVTVLPDKGADIYRFIHKASGLDFLWKNPVGLWPPGSPSHDGSAGVGFLENYQGTWQELFPSANDPTLYQGNQIPFHGEVALLPWSWTILSATPDEIAVEFSVETRLTTFRLDRIMRLRKGEGRLTLDETVTNTGSSMQHFVWGHHCVVGGPWLEPGCILDLPACTITTIEQIYEANTARLAPGQNSTWPHAAGRKGEVIDLSVLPGPEVRSHDDVYLTDLREGYAAVLNPRLGVGFRLRWNPAVFRWIVSWQPYGGAEALPFKGMPYAIGIEPWISQKPLGAAVEAGEARVLAPGETFSTTLVAEVLTDHSSSNHLAL